MKIEMIPINGIWTRALIVDEDTPHTLCENCGSKPVYVHPLLVKEDNDWCTKCNDDHYRGNMTEDELAIWTLKQMADGKAVIVVREM